MHIGIILHGPEIIDTCSAKKIIDILKQKHEVIAKLGGTMGRTAVLDAGLEDIIDISQGLTPSETIKELEGKIDLAILLNHGKTLETGRYFGNIVASKLNNKAFIHIERPDNDGKIIYYSDNLKKCSEYIQELLKKDFGILEIEKGNGTLSCINIDGMKITRRISGAFEGENIRLDGVVIGEVLHKEPEIICINGKIIETRGIKIKPHGLEKLENRIIDLKNVKIKTGNIRRSHYLRKIKKVSDKKFETIAIIDHCAESVFELIKDADIVITVGDDTTAISGDILTRLGIPIIGITDGDIDDVLPDTSVPSGSIIIRLKSGYDDIVGKEIFQKLMENKQKLKIKDSDEILARIFGICEKHIIDVAYY